MLSGLVLPGLGQLKLRRIGRGVGIMVLFFTGVVLLVFQCVNYALAILEQIYQAGEIVSGETIIKAAESAASSGGNIKILFYFIICVWLFGMIDAYLAGKKP